MEGDSGLGMIEVCFWIFYGSMRDSWRVPPEARYIILFIGAFKLIGVRKAAALFPGEFLL